MERKRFLVLAVALVMLFGFAQVAGASFVQNNVNPVRFFAVDSDSDTNVSLSVINTFSGWTLQWSTDNSSWSSTTPSITTVAGASQLTYFRIVDDNDANNIDNIGDLEFWNPSGTLWHNVNIFWNGIKDGYSKVTLTGVSEGDEAAPVPLPTSALFLFSGLLGLVAFGSRKKIMH